MSSDAAAAAAPPVEAPEGQEGARASGAAHGGCAACPKTAPAPPEGQPDGAPHHAWLLEPLDDVRYLISCTNWY